MHTIKPNSEHKMDRFLTSKVTCIRVFVEVMEASGGIPS